MQEKECYTTPVKKSRLEKISSAKLYKLVEEHNKSISPPHPSLEQSNSDHRDEMIKRWTHIVKEHSPTIDMNELLGEIQVKA